MTHQMFAAALVAAAIASSGPAWAEDDASLEARVAQAEKRIAEREAPSAREIQSSVDAYLGAASPDAVLVAGHGTSGYDGGFWMRGGSFLLKLNVTIQTRWEAWDWDKEAVEPRPGGDLSGFSLPRVTLKLSGDATCNVHYYAELEFGHHGLLSDNGVSTNTLSYFFFDPSRGFANHAFDAGEVCREAWIEFDSYSLLALRMGLIKLPTTRQMMTPPEMQQFVDVSLASAFVGSHVPGYTDRNRDYGVMAHGIIGCDGQGSYMATVTNGDGTVHRNVLDQTTNDNFAYAGRVNWDIKGHMGYEEGALRQNRCVLAASVGAWGYLYHDVLNDKPHRRLGTRTLWGVDAAAGYGSWSFTGAYTHMTLDSSDTFTGSVDGWCWLAQVGFLVPDTAWEVAVRYSAYGEKASASGTPHIGADEWAAAVNYYIDGHADKVTLDAAFVQSNDDGNVVGDVYAGYNAAVFSSVLGSFKSDAVMLRLQWQLAL